VGREPSGQAFNSILQLEHEGGIPRNPFINAGAIATTDAMLAGHAPREFLGELRRFIRTAAGNDSIHINEKVAASEQETGDLNLALAYFMATHGNMVNPVERTLGAYFHQCAVEMSCIKLARAALFLTGAGSAPRLVSPARRRRINAMMMLCGHRDPSGDFAYRVGLSGKSGVGGGIMVVAPAKAGIAAWSPGLNSQGNSKLGTDAVETFARATRWSVFD
jgi:glutaminase